jgi:hypothetical protein
MQPANTTSQIRIQCQLRCDVCLAVGCAEVTLTLGVSPAYKSEIMKFGLLQCREQPPKLLQGTRFQERSFQIKDHKLLLLKDKKVDLTGSLVGEGLGLPRAGFKP